MVAAIRAELAGVNVACVCDLALPCHGDVVLAVAAGTVDDKPGQEQLSLEESLPRNEA